MFCTLLYNGLVYNNENTQITVSPCCYFSENTIVDDTHTLEYWREQWRHADVERTCQKCIRLESMGIPSYREASFDISTGVSDKIEVLTVAVNKQCNLACASCDSNSSSFWYQENLRNNIEQAPKVHSLHQENRAGDTTKQFIDTLAKQDLSSLRYVKFGGGEPLMSDIHLKILELVPNPDQVTVHYTSNFSIMPTEKAFEQWKRFKLIKWVASLDGVGDQFSLLRWPYTWERLNQFRQQAWESVPHNVMFGVEHTLNPLNVYYYDEFKLWFDTNFSINRYGDPSDLNLHPSWDKTNIAFTPPALRLAVESKLGTAHPVVRMLAQHPWVGTAKPLVDYLDKLDILREQNWRKTFAEVESYFD